MDYIYYSDDTISKFEKQVVCQNDPLLYKYYLNDDITEFRKRLKPDSFKLIEQSVYVYITDMLRPIILDTVKLISKHMKPFGKLIITGGEAFNTYFDRDHRIVTSDIDTKFVPTFKTGTTFFSMLQVCKLYLWDYLGELSMDIDKKIKKSLQLNKLTRFLGISLPTHGPFVTRRYSLIRKTMDIPQVLIDVELFALDLRLKYYSPMFGKCIVQNVGGILDIAIMRPYEFGYEVVYNSSSVASKQFLINDIIFMQSLGLRPDKVKKDRERLVSFATHVLKIKGVDSSMSLSQIYAKIKTPSSVSSYRIHRKNPSVSFVQSIIKNTNPLKYFNRTTVPFKTKLLLEHVIGSNTPLHGFKTTSSEYFFDVQKRKWRKSTDPSYIRNMYQYRPTALPVTFKPIPIQNTLYGWNPVRNHKMSPILRTKSALIPFIGLKNINKVKIQSK